MNKHNIVINTQAWCVEAQTHQLKLSDKALEPLASDEVQIKNHAIGLNPVDFKVINNGVLSDGQIAGVDGAGIVTAVGSSELSHLIGTRVAYHQNLHLNGSFAKHINIKAKVIIPLPNEISFDVAASLPCPLMTAWQSVEKIPTNKKPVLVSGASGAVGRFLVQLLTLRGFEVSVTASPKRHEDLMKLGASHCYYISHQFPERAFFAIVDTRSADSAESLAPALQSNGHMICIQGRINQQPLPSFGRCISLHEIALAALHREGLESDWEELILAGQTLFSMISNGDLVANDVQSYPFEALAQTLVEFEHQRTALKYVITC